MPLLFFKVSTVIMENEFQQDYDIRDCAAIKVSTLLDNMRILKINLASCTVRQQIQGVFFVCGA